MSDIQSSLVIFLTYATGFKRLNIVGSAHDIPFFETRKKSLQGTQVSELSDTYGAYVLECSSARTLETMNLSELRVQSSLKRAWFSIHRHQYYVLVIFFFETARNPHLKDSRKLRSCLWHVNRNISWIHWYRSFHDDWDKVKKRRNVFLCANMCWMCLYRIWRSGQ